MVPAEGSAVVIRREFALGVVEDLPDVATPLQLIRQTAVKNKPMQEIELANNGSQGP